MKLTDKQFEKKRKDIIDSFYKLDIANISLWKLYQEGILKGIDLL